MRDRRKPLPYFVGAPIVVMAQRMAETQHARTRKDLLRVDDHLSDLLAFTGRPE
ncbi:MAG: hypothetical protein R3174_12530 [Gammaproteobacteria bacterium]|nr:hypothetical protein [Gammaproteobacteria bacterium]